MLLLTLREYKTAGGSGGCGVAVGGGQQGPEKFAYRGVTRGLAFVRPGAAGQGSGTHQWCSGSSEADESRQPHKATITLRLRPLSID